MTWDSGGFLYIGSLIYSMTPDFGGESDEGAELESAIFGGGRIFATQDASGRSCSAVFHICDHLGSVRATVDDGGNILERNSYYAYGRRHEDGSIRDAGNRWRYSGKEEQYSFGVPYIDYGARMYDSELGRWFSPDPMSEQYYSVSPYVYCGDNPVNYVDPDGKAWETFWDVANIIIGVESFANNITEGKIGNALLDATGIIIDVAAACIPFVPGGAGSVIKTARLADNAVGVAVSGEKTYQTYTKTHPVTGKIYSGRTSGKASPEQNVYNRDKHHHKNKEGYGPAVLDKSSQNPDAIRGREQYLIDLHGGAQSVGGTSGNTYNGISKTNPKAEVYNQARIQEFGE